MHTTFMVKVEGWDYLRKVEIGRDGPNTISFQVCSNFAVLNVHLLYER
jgi:hypothetical protein